MVWPLQSIGPHFSGFKNRIGDHATIVKIDVDKNPQVAGQYQIQSVPTLMIFKQGNLLWRQAGVIPAKQLEEKLMQFK